LVIANVIGGLGNQMFQYAAARSLSLRSKQPLYLDITDFDGYGLHQGFELHNIFCCKVVLATVKDLHNVLGWRAARLMRRILVHPELSFLRTKRFVFEPHFHYWPELIELRGSVYLQGYWQSENYFSDVIDSIRADFTFRHPLSETNLTVLEKINASRSAVSLHIRRGDYLSNPRTLAEHGLCSIDYYLTAVRYIAARVADPEFFVFSDDSAWTKANLKLEYPCHYIDHNHGSESYNDMRLMSMCHHHIIANSSFSWWGAWLNSSNKKIVIAPKHWFAAMDNSTKDLFPDGWIQI